MSYQPKAAEVKELRQKTGLPMMDCKKALVESEGDMDRAIDDLRKRGGKIQSDAEGRETQQGRIEAHLEPEQAVAMVQVLCEQAPTAKNEVFAGMVKAFACQAARADSEPDAASFLDSADSDAPGKTLNDRLGDVINQIRENMKLSAVARIKADGGVLGSYVHFNFQEGAIIRLEGGQATNQLANEVCMHIVATKPLAVSREDIPADLIAKEREIAREQAAATGKPDNILDKIAEGKLKTFFAEKALLEQEFVKDPSVTVGELLKKAGGATISQFVRFRIGD